LKSYCFINLRDIPSIENAIWFYTHNSMTNLAVINKNVYSKHIWIGHGDSEKVASIKRIIRIYDRSLVAGEKSIERYYQSGLFREEEAYRFVRIGKAALCSVMPRRNPQGKPAILFAPTWEGAMDEENYSTLHLPHENAALVRKLADQTATRTLIIKLHPNTGIRDSRVIDQTLSTLRELIGLGLETIFVAQPGDWVYGYVHKAFGDRLICRDRLYALEGYHLVAGVTNISAMATMIDAEAIKTFVLYDSRIPVQDRVRDILQERIDLRHLPENYDTTHRPSPGLISYEKPAWGDLPQSELFEEVIDYVR